MAGEAGTPLRKKVVHPQLSGFVIPAITEQYFKPFRRTDRPPDFSIRCTLILYCLYFLSTV